MSDKEVDVYDEEGNFLFTLPEYNKASFWDRVANWVASFIMWARR